MNNEPPPGWAYAPDLPLQTSPLWQWPPRPVAVLKWYWDSWFWVTVTLLVLAIAVASALWATPSADAPLALFAGVLARNVLILLAVAGGLHLWFYVWRKQDGVRRYDARDLAKGRVFTFSDQVRDNMFWTLASGAVIWSAYEALMLWALAAGHIAPTSFAQSPIWFCAVFFLIPIWESFYFYWIHRFLHWPPLYRLAHALHHRNTNIGPWSGLSMHPVEHLMFFGSVLIHFVLPTHPIHITFHLMFYGLLAVTTHTGFEGIVSGNKKRLHLGNFHHQMHHRYFECNYGTLEVPWDKLFGSFHDGTAESHAAMKRRRAKASSG